MFQMLKSGGILMIPILVCGLVATYIIIERLIYFYSIKKKDKLLKENLREAFESENFSGAEAFCKAAATPFAEVVEKIIKMRYLDQKLIEEVAEAQMERVIPKMEHFLTMLTTIANISTLLGLFGTVTGNIKAFGVLGEGASMGNPAILAGAIAEALVTTAAGLFVAIPSTIFSNYFNRKVNKEIVLMETDVTEIILQLSKRI